VKPSDSAAAGQPETPKLPHAVFISYSNEDKAVADAVCAALEAENIGCWMAPRDVKGGRPYSGQITQAIRETRMLLLILSEAANRSKQVLQEVERAAHCQNHILTFRIERISPGDDLAYFLGADQRVDGFQPLPRSRHFPTLIHQTRTLLRSASTRSEGEDESDAAAPEIFAHFRILRPPANSLFRLGKGGMGVTYKAIDTVLNRPVALKVIAAELLRSPQARHRFLREAQAPALIHHPHVATIHHFGEEEDACLFRELDLGPNFTSWDAAMPGDFMKMFWNPNVGRHENSQSAIFLGVSEANGIETVHFWSSNIPLGFGEKAIPKAKIASVIFSRLQNPQNIQRALYTLSPRNVYLGSLISKDSSFAEALQESGAR
jgi:hypothetical protein